ncbi:hypothetical protein UACE39S_06502 [Ureibacillus acetophenoni]
MELQIFFSNEEIKYISIYKQIKQMVLTKELFGS